MTHGREKSDSPIVPVKPTNKAASATAEPVEGRGEATGNAPWQSRRRTPSRARLSQALERVREAANERFYVKHPRSEPGARIGLAGILCGGCPVMGIPTAIEGTKSTKGPRTF